MALEAPQDESPAGRRWPRIGCLASCALAVLLLAGILIVWLSREAIAENVIADTLKKNGVEATYEIASIGADRQILHNIVVGDPDRPDLTIEWAIVSIEPRLGFPRIGSVRLVRPRLHGTYRDGQLSLGALDPLIFTDSEEPFELPDLDLSLVDGRALLETDYGNLGARLSGAGNLRGGFVGELGAVAENLSHGACRLGRASLYGEVTVEGQRPAIAGPLRMGRLDCGSGAPAIANATADLSLKALAGMAGFEGDAKLAVPKLAQAGNAMEDLTLDTRFTWRDRSLTARYQLAGRSLATPGMRMGRLEAEGSLRALRSFERIEVVGSVDGRDLDLGDGLDNSLASLMQSSRGTLLEPIARRVRAVLAREGSASRLGADYTARVTDGVASVVIPNASLRGGSGAALLNLSRFQLLAPPDEAPAVSGSFVAGGRDLPRIEGRMEQAANGQGVFRVAMAPYAAGDARLAVPELVVRRRGDGALGFAGEVLASGAIPGGRVEGLAMPLSGSWTASGELAMWEGCTDIRFQSLTLSQLALDRRSVNLCAPTGSSILRYGQAGLRLAAGTPSLEMAGRLGETPVTLKGGPIGIAYPGTVSASMLDVTLGPAESATRFAISNIAARIGSEISGTFTGADVRLYAVPLDVLAAEGQWSYSNGRLLLTDGTFRVEDRQDADRFEPLIARGASLTLADNRITADALLREPNSDAEIVRVGIAHDLSNAAGRADLFVDNLAFGPALQPTRLSDMALGVVANMRGTVKGTGRIDWNADAVTSRGRFSSESLDFAAAFGPVRGAAGTIEFTDLIGLSTAPGQTLQVASVNPGIEVYDGTVHYSLTGGEVLAVEDATWPFLGGTLTMRPVTLRFGAAETRNYVFEIEGLEAARFIERMELNNLGATGTFDGTIPVVFDASGNGSLQGGVLQSREPGGNVSYVGELTYEDLSPMANYAFDMLRSLNYRQMSVDMNGPLTGEIVTRVRFDGVSQGEGARQNFLTRRIARLPIRFLVNVRAPFYSLISSVRAIYDPAAIKDPRDLGLLDAQGNVLRATTNGEEPIQPRASEDAR